MISSPTTGQVRPGAPAWGFVLAMLLATVVPRAEASTANAASFPWSAPPTTRVGQEERRFASGGRTLAGTLHLPAGNARPVPAVVVTHSASSPLRDASLYAHLKTILPAMGIAVFVYDRRGSGDSGTQDAGGDFQLLADDAIAAVRSLKADPRIDPRRIGTWGLSQGGWISVLAAARSRDIAFVVSASAPVVTADVQMIFSSTNHLRAHGYPQAEIDQMVATRKAVDDYMRGTGTREAAQRLLDAATAKPWFKYLYMGRTFKDREVSGWRREIENDPLENLEGVRVPLLVLYGADDAVVPVARSVERLRDIAARMPRMQVHVVAGADHAMQTAAGLDTSLDPDKDGTERPDSAEYFAVLAGWLAGHGFTGGAGRPTAERGCTAAARCPAPWRAGAASHSPPYPSACPAPAPGGPLASPPEASGALAARPKHAAETSQDRLATPQCSRMPDPPSGSAAVDGAVAIATPSSACIMATPSMARAIPAGRNQAANPPVPAASITRKKPMPLPSSRTSVVHNVRNAVASATATPAR